MRNALENKVLQNFIVPYELRLPHQIAWVGLICLLASEELLLTYAQICMKWEIETGTLALVPIEKPLKVFLLLCQLLIHFQVGWRGIKRKHLNCLDFIDVNTSCKPGNLISTWNNDKEIVSLNIHYTQNAIALEIITPFGVFLHIGQFWLNPAHIALVDHKARLFRGQLNVTRCILIGLRKEWFRKLRLCWIVTLLRICKRFFHALTAHVNFETLRIIVHSKHRIIVMCPAASRMICGSPTRAWCRNIARFLATPASHLLLLPLILLLTLAMVLSKWIDKTATGIAGGVTITLSISLLVLGGRWRRIWWRGTSSCRLLKIMLLMLMISLLIVLLLWLSRRK